MEFNVLNNLTRRCESAKTVSPFTLSPRSSNESGLSVKHSPTTHHNEVFSYKGYDIEQYITSLHPAPQIPHLSNSDNYRNVSHSTGNASFAVSHYTHQSMEIDQNGEMVDLNHLHSSCPIRPCRIANGNLYEPIVTVRDSAVMRPWSNSPNLSVQRFGNLRRILLDESLMISASMRPYAPSALALGQIETQLQHAATGSSKRTSNRQPLQHQQHHPIGGHNSGSVSTTQARTIQTPFDVVKDAAYFERRKKNNEASKKWRSRRRLKGEEIAMRATHLKRMNLKLKIELEELERQIMEYRTP